MKALVYTAPNEVTFRDEPEPVAGDGDVMLAVEAAGICGSDMHAYHGRDPRRQPPLILGHELAGRILDGPDAGTRVTVNPLVTCGRCDYCVSGRDNLCARRTMIGMSRPGGFAQRIAVPQRTLIEIPQAMSARAAALTEPAATALHALALAMRALVRPLPEARLLVIGGGAVGLLAALLARTYGCRDVALAETNPLRRQAAQSAADVSVLDPGGGLEGLDSVADLVIDAVGAAATRDTALRAVRPGGVVVHIGLLDWTSPIDMRKLTLAEITLIGTYTYSTADLRATVSALHAGAFGGLEWVAERSLDEGAAAFADLDAGRSGAAKILLRPH
ncbi:MAG: alcohol dehydrogenase catalytic domain-containing protein [Betaproteobacteria bacterium]